MSEELSNTEIKKRLEELEYWSHRNGELVFEADFSDYRETAFFANTVFSEAEAMFHHPKVEVEYGSVRIELYTHEVEGITEKDFDLANKIEEKMKELEG